MRKTIGKFVRRYLYDKRLGGRRVLEIWRDGKKIWPTLGDTVYSCVLDVAAVEGSIDWAYWLHALDAAARLGAGAECHIKLAAGGREYMLNSTFGGWYLARYDGRATVVFGDDGPLVEKLRVGDEVVARLVVPQHEGAAVGTAWENQSVSGSEPLPWLPGSCLRVLVQKGRKKMSAGCRFCVTGRPSGTVHVQGFAQKNGHCRGSYWGNAFARDMWVINGRVGRYCDGAVAGDGRLDVEACWYNAGCGRVFPVFPGFDRVIRFRVSAVTRHG